MVKIHKKVFPYQVGMYKMFQMMHVNNDLEIVKNTSTSCRETFISYIRRKYNPNTPTNCRSINTRRLYVLATLGASYIKDSKKAWNNLFQKTERSLKLVNSFERYYKWPLSKVLYVDDTRKTWCTPSSLFIGTRKWATSPYLISAYLLFLRAGTRVWLKDSVINESDHNKLITKLINNSNKYKGVQVDAEHIYNSIKMINILMANHTELFSDKPKGYHWSMERLQVGVPSYTEGIRKLADGKTGYKELYKKCKKLEVEYDKQKAKK